MENTRPQGRLYAYATRNEQGDLVIHQEVQTKELGEFENIIKIEKSQPRVEFRIPVSSSEKIIKAHCAHFSQGSLEHELVEISALIATGVVPRDRVINLDYEDHTKKIPTILSKKEIRDKYQDLEFKNYQNLEHKDIPYYNNRK